MKTSKLLFGGLLAYGTYAYLTKTEKGKELLSKSKEEFKNLSSKLSEVKENSYASAYAEGEEVKQSLVSKISNFYDNNRTTINALGTLALPLISKRLARK